MVPNQDHTSLSLEYFLSVNDELWRAPDEELVQSGARELEMLGLARADEVLDGMILRSSEAYPVYDEHYQEHLSIVRTYLGSFSNLHLMGRNGLHRYNNMDLAMLSAMEVHSCPYTVPFRSNVGTVFVVNTLKGIVLSWVSICCWGKIEGCVYLPAFVPNVCHQVIHLLLFCLCCQWALESKLTMLLEPLPFFVQVTTVPVHDWFVFMSFSHDFSTFTCPVTLF